MFLQIQHDSAWLALSPEPRWPDLKIDKGETSKLAEELIYVRVRPPDCLRNLPCSELSGDPRPVEAAILVDKTSWFVFSGDISDSTEKAFALEDRFPFACDLV